MLRKRNGIPGCGGSAMSTLTLDILHAAYDGPHASKRIARDAGTSHRTAEKWWAGLTEMRASAFVRLAQSNDKMRAELLRRLGDHGYVDAEAGGVAASGAGYRVGVDCGLDRPAAAAGKVNAVRVSSKIGRAAVTCSTRVRA
jgi:hypothetical protein